MNNEVITFFKNLGLENRIMQFKQSSATVELAASAIGCLPKQIAKTLAFDVGGNPVLVVVCGSGRVDNAKFKQAFNAKANMIKFDMVKEKIGHMAGEVCPFCVKENVKIYLDVSIKELSKMYLAAGSENSVVGLTLEEVEKYSNYLGFVDICKE